MVEIGTAKTAARSSTSDRFDVGLYGQKIGSEHATTVEHIPTSHREGCLLVTKRGRLPSGTT